MANHYEVPNWAGKPPTGLHLDVLKEETLIQKLMLDQKKCYLFGRNSQLNDFCIDHASCSRVHAAFVYHKHLNRPFLVDLGSTHGTFIGSMRLEAHKPTQLPIDSTFHFGASTRYYVLRERPVGGSRTIMEEIPNSSDGQGALLGLPETQTELDNLTEFNTAHNRRISMLGISTEDGNEIRPGVQANRKRKRRAVHFNEDNDIINPEDVDPSVGRFRNLIQTTVIPSASKKARNQLIGIQHTSSSQHASQLHDLQKHLHPSAIMPHLYQDLPPELNTGVSNANSGQNAAAVQNFPTTSAAMNKLGMMLPNPAPDVEPNMEPMEICTKHPGMGAGLVGSTSLGNQMLGELVSSVEGGDTLEPKKKKYAKEAWPGRKPLLTSSI
ncbi:nuclear inhibitor of protein phosphatase 1 [Ctenocephalides felis]|uniref:nuclear inhibitor of protein phosphatase 1 n=1 Tax=Ctenocephalides felis TaxID=7515 RepID=UPI000E6E51C7|nr:nuclear inhibitor of protein phosphatase 1 [Ctenocephalides felis]